MVHFPRRFQQVLPESFNPERILESGEREETSFGSDVWGCFRSDPGTGRTGTRDGRERWIGETAEGTEGGVEEAGREMGRDGWVEKGVGQV